MVALAEPGRMEHPHTSSGEDPATAAQAAGMTT